MHHWAGCNNKVQQQRPVIALIEDNPADARMLEYALGRTGQSVDVIVLTDGKKAIDFLCENTNENGLPDCDLIVMDLNLPFFSGYEVLARIKTDPVLKRIPVIVLSSSSNPNDVERCYNEGANSYICKPIELKDILSMASFLTGFWLGSAKLPANARELKQHTFSV